MKKKCLALILCGMLIPNVISYAATETTWHNGPSLVPGSTWKSEVETLSSSYDTAQVSNTYTYFRYFKSLRTSLSSNNGRILTVCMFEDDSYGGDDYVKTYIGTFNGRKLRDISVTNISEEKNIESSGDNVAELYLKMHLSKCNGDPNAKKSGSFFQYKFGLR